MGGNLPVQLTSFVGRQAEVVAVTAVLGEHRLVTLTGAGGCGKTRLAQEVAARLDGDVCWVDLAPLADPSLVPVTVARALGMSEPPEPAVDAVVRRLVARPALLVLDNCEHLIDACADVARRVAAECPATRVLATSRELLGVEGEVRRPVAPLDDDASVRLFAERAQASAPAFALSADNAAAVAEVCRRLDGLPLAIELAAARIRLLSVEQIADGLADRFRLLTGGARTALPRQRTLEGSLDWSHQLLGEKERVVFRRLAAFAGSFALDGAEVVCGFDPVAPEEVLDVLGALVDRSLVQVVGPADSLMRYRMLESVAAYARRRLADAGEADVVRDRHADWCASLATSDDGPERIDAELDNLRTALEWAAGNVTAMRIVGALLLYWFARSETAVGRARLEASVGDGPACVERAAALTSLCLVAYRAGDMVAAARHGDEAIDLARRFDDSHVLARALHFRAWVRYWGEADRVGAWRDFAEVESLLADTDDHVLRGLNLALLGWSCIDTTRTPEARQLLEDGLRLLPAVGAPRANALFALGWLDNLEGRVEDAGAHADEALQVAQDAGDRYVEILARSMLVMLSAKAGRFDEAHAQWEQGLALAQEHRMPTGEASMRFSGAMVALGEGDADAAAAALDAAHACSPMPWFVGLVRAFQAQVAVKRGHLDEAKAHARDALRLGRLHDSVTATSPALVVSAAVARVEGDGRGAERLLHEALDRLDGVGFRPLLETVLEALGEEPGTSPEETAARLRRGRGRRGRPLYGWDSLTPTEGTVVELVAKGLTNPQIATRLFVSPRTVQAHLAHVFAKLGVSTRAELAAAATARALGPPPA